MPSERKEIQIEEDLVDRQVHLVEFRFKTVLGEKAEYTRWINMSRDSLSLAKRDELYRGSIVVKDRTYSTKHIVHVDATIIKSGYIKKSVKKNEGGYKWWSSLTEWDFNSYYNEDDLEGVAEYELERKIK